MSNSVSVVGNVDKMHAVWTGRFQPPHIGHFAILQHSLRTLAMPHVAVLTAYFGWRSSGNYGSFADAAYAPARNPLTVWERFTLMRLGLQQYDLHTTVSVLTAPRHDVNWSVVAGFYPARRLICLTNKDAFEDAKTTLWHERGDRVHVFADLTEDKVLTSSEIRRQVANGADWQNFIPETAHDYFIEINAPDRLFGER